MVEDPEAEHHVELAVLLEAERPDVALPEVDLDAEHARREARLLEVRLAALDRDDLGAATGELQGVHPLEAGEVEHAGALEVTGEEVADDLRDAAQLDLVPGRLRPDRVEAGGEPDVVRRPGAVTLLERLLLAADRLDVDAHRPPATRL